MLHTRHIYSRSASDLRAKSKQEEEGGGMAAERVHVMLGSVLLRGGPASSTRHRKSAVPPSRAPPSPNFISSYTFTRNVLPLYLPPRNCHCSSRSAPGAEHDAGRAQDAHRQRSRRCWSAHMQPCPCWLAERRRADRHYSLNPLDSRARRRRFKDGGFRRPDGSRDRRRRPRTGWSVCAAMPDDARAPFRS